MAKYLIDTGDVAPVGVKHGRSGKYFSLHSGMIQTRLTPRPYLPFRSVNLRDQPGYDPGLQRHHLLPRQLLSQRCFWPFFDEIGREWTGFDDFRSNGMLLPACDAAALRIGLPLHRGPHRDYNAMVIERVGEVEADWANARRRASLAADDDAIARLSFLQRSLRRSLLDRGGKRLALNRFDPVGCSENFAGIDAMVDVLWPASDPSLAELPPVVDPSLAWAGTGPLRAASPAFA